MGSTVAAKSIGLDRHRLSPVTLLTTMVLVYAAAEGVELLAHKVGVVSGIWIANAILLAVMMRHSRRDWLWLAGAGLCANMVADLGTYPVTISCLFASLNILEVLLVAVPLRLLRLDRNFTKPATLLAFYALAAGPAPMISAALCAAFFHFVHHAPLGATALNWYSADALGLIIAVPPLMTVKLEAVKEMFRRDQIVGTLGLISLTLGTILLNYVARNYPIAFLFFPAVVLLTFQRGFAGGTLGLFLAALYLLVPALFGNSSGALHTHSIREQLTIVQIFIAVMGFSIVLVGAALEERRRLEQWLANAIARAENSREEAVVAKDSAEKANRTKSMFLANMSHELRTPLNAVIGFAEMMNSQVYGPLGDPRYRHYAELIQGAGKHLLDLINDILDMSKIEAGKQELKREKLDLAELVQGSIAIMREQAMNGHVSLQSDLPSTPTTLFADRRAMKQILLNLLSNAIKFTPEGGRVSIRGRVTEGRLLLSVQDTGVGIPADQVYRLGNPFVQIRNNAGTSQTGTGLGLALVRALAEMHDGKMTIESVEGKGTTVSIALPLNRTESLAA